MVDFATPNSSASAVDVEPLPYRGDDSGLLFGAQSVPATLDAWLELPLRFPDGP